MARDPLRRRPVTQPPQQLAPVPVIGGLVAIAAALALAMTWLGPASPVPHSPAATLPDRLLALPGGDGAPAGEPRAPAAEARPFLDPAGSGAVAYAAGDFDAALAHYQAAVTLNPEDAESRSNLGQVLVRLNRPEEALPHFDQAIAAVPSRWAYHFNRGRALGLLERWDAAIASYGQAQQLVPDDYAITFNLGQALHRSGDEAGAVAQYRRAIELDPSDASFRLALGTSYERLEKRAEAAAAYAEYLRLLPGAADADKVRARITQLTSAS